VAVCCSKGCCSGRTGSSGGQQQQQQHHWQRQPQSSSHQAGPGAQQPSYKQFLQLRENINLQKHLGTLLQILSVNDDPLTIEAEILTSR
jgi:hypothetical protein